jgi:hypothetical protein
MRCSFGAALIIGAIVLSQPDCASCRRRRPRLPAGLARTDGRYNAAAQRLFSGRHLFLRQKNRRWAHVATGGLLVTPAKIIGGDLAFSVTSSVGEPRVNADLLHQRLSRIRRAEPLRRDSGMLHGIASDRDRHQRPGRTGQDDQSEVLEPEAFKVESASPAPSLRAKRSNPGAKKKDWIASSQELLAMTELAVPNQPIWRDMPC